MKTSQYRARPGNADAALAPTSRPQSGAMTKRQMMLWRGDKLARPYYNADGSVSMHEHVAGMVERADNADARTVRERAELERLAQQERVRRAMVEVGRYTFSRRATVSRG